MVYDEEATPREPWKFSMSERDFKIVHRMFLTLAWFMLALGLITGRYMTAMVLIVVIVVGDYIVDRLYTAQFEFDEEEFFGDR